MAEFEDVAKSIAVSIVPDKPDYINEARRTLETIWARTVKAYDWWFMRAATPLTLNLAANVNQYKIEKEELGTILCIGTALGQPMYYPLSWTEWQRRLDREKVVTDYYTELQPSGTPVSKPIFTIAGKDGDGISILIQPTPTEALTRYIWYQYLGTKANFGNCPDSLIPCLIHGAKSIAAAPKALDIPGRRAQWESLQLSEYQMYNVELDEAARREDAVRVYEQPAYAEPLTADRIEEVNET